MSSIKYVVILVIVVFAGCSSNYGSDADMRVVERFMTALDAQNFDELNEILCPDLVAHLAGDDLDRDAFIEMARGAYATFPDFRHEIDELFATTDRVVLRATDYATHAESGRSVSFSQISIYRIENECIAEWWEEYDEFGLNEQLSGPIPPTAQ
jgi:predicted ester cyclase